MLVKLPIHYEILTEKTKEKIVSEGEEILWNAESWDASLGGMYIISDKLLKTTDQLNLKITLPHTDNPLRILAEVVWVDRSGAGLRFISMKAEDIQDLERFLNSIPTSD
jgi:Tfp pilus assembly protein PilZ